MALTKGFARNNAKTPLDQRLADMATIVCNADGSPRVGVLGNANASIVTHGGGMNLAVAAAEFVTSKGKADGVMIFTNDGSVNVLIGAAPASNSRIDVLWVKHEDNTTGDAASLPIFGVTAGVAGAIPVKPAIPTGALELATLRIYSGTVATNGGANTLTNTYQMTTSRGGVVPFRTKADLSAWATAVDGQPAYVFGDVSAYFNGAYERIAGAWAYRDYAEGAIAPGTAALIAGGTSLRRTADDYVELTFSATHAAQSAAFSAFTLPVGFRPLAGTSISFTHQSYDGGFANRANVGLIADTGVVTLNQTAQAAQTVSRSGSVIRFKAA